MGPGVFQRPDLELKQMGLLQVKRFISRRVPGEYLEYYYYKPETDEKLPLLLFLHGSGSRGKDISAMNVSGPMKELEKGRPMPAVLAAPHCHANTWFDLFQVLCEFTEEAAAWPEVDGSRVYLTGNSMGGYTAWQLAMSHPEIF
ncbi:MAG: hypothetical protein II776_06560, partial [Clostridia bacterium]|nr:hypothetical protein [Clostridia bacterium]